jgi:hypothetical protein
LVLFFQKKFPEISLKSPPSLPATRKKAFAPYQFTILCGDFDEDVFPPQPLIDSLSYGCLPLMKEGLYHSLPRMFFHLSDASQGVRNMRLGHVEDYLSDVAGEGYGTIFSVIMA